MSQKKKCDACGAFVNKAGKAYLQPSLTVDAAIVRGSKEERQVLLIKRKNDPYKGHLAFPGGFVDYGEDPTLGVLRELKEETTLKAKNPVLIGAYGNPVWLLQIFFRCQLIELYSKNKRQEIQESTLSVSSIFVRFFFQAQTKMTLESSFQNVIFANLGGR